MLLARPVDTEAGHARARLRHLDRGQAQELLKQPHGTLLRAVAAGRHGMAQVAVLLLVLHDQLAVDAVVLALADLGRLGVTAARVVALGVCGACVLHAAHIGHRYLRLACWVLLLLLLLLVDSVLDG